MITDKEKQKHKDGKNVDNKLITISLVLNFIFGLIWFSLLLFTIFGDPILTAFEYYTRVENGSLVHELMLKEIEGIHLSAYIFNVTNPERFISGEDEKLKLEEVGPFTYKEYRSNVDVEIDTENQRLWCTPKVRLEYVPEESIGRPEDVVVTAPNIPMLGVAARTPFLGQLGFNLLTNQLGSKSIVTMSASDYLWGYKEPLLSLVHDVGYVSFEKMGILDRIYDKNRKYRLEASITDNEKYMLKSLNGHKKLNMGDSGDPDSCELCNTFENSYEGIGYSHSLTPDFPIRIYRNGLCRILDLDYYGTKKTDYGADALVYKFSDNFFKLDPNETSKGYVVLPDCFMGSPLAFSKAHLKDVDPAVYARVEGMNPNKTEDKGWITVDPRLGFQLETVLSLQLNLVLEDVSFNSQTKSFSNMVIPICYLKIEQPPLPEESTVFLRNVYYLGPRIILGLQIVLPILVLLFWGYVAKAVYQYFKSKSETAISFPVETCHKIPPSNATEEPLMTETVFKNEGLI